MVKYRLKNWGLAVTAVAAITVGLFSSGVIHQNEQETGPSCSVTVSSLSSAQAEMEKGKGIVVCLSAGVYEGTLKTPENCGVETAECWVLRNSAPGAGAKLTAAKGVEVSIKGDLEIFGNNYTVEGIKVQNVEIGGSGFWVGINNANNILFKNVKGRNFQIQSATNVTIEGGEWGPSSSCGGPNSPGGNNAIRDVLEHAQRPENILINKTVIHDVQSYNLTTCHIEGLAIFAGKNVKVTNNTFYGDSVKDVFEQNCCGSEPEEITVEKNVMAAPIDNSGANGNPVGTISNSPALSFESSKKITVRANRVNGIFSFNEVEGSHALTEVSVLYNFAENSNPCNTGAIYKENVWKGSAKCDTTDRTVGELPFTNHANDATLNYSLTGTYKGWPE